MAMNQNSFHLSRTASVGVVLVVLVAAAIAYTVFQGRSTDETITVSETATASEANFVTLASELDVIVFDVSILSDPRFLSLVNIHTAITPEPAGRADPFSKLR